MNKELQDLARRAVACPAFRPMVGMVGMDGTVILSVGPLVETSEIVEWRDGGTIRRDYCEATWPVLRASGWRPDFDQPATRGCLLALVREALGEPLANVEVRQLGNGWRAVLRVPAGSEGWRGVWWQWWRASRCPATAEACVLVTALEAWSRGEL